MTLTTRYHGYTIYDKAMKVRMLYCELKWEVLSHIVNIVMKNLVCFHTKYAFLDF